MYCILVSARYFLAELQHSGHVTTLESRISLASVEVCYRNDPLPGTEYRTSGYIVPVFSNHT